MESLPPPPPQPLSAPADRTHPELRKLGSSTSLPEAYVYRSIQPACDYHHSGKCQILTYELLDLEFNPQYHWVFFFQLLFVQRVTMTFHPGGKV